MSDISYLDIFRSAQAMLKRYGKEGASFAAAERAELLAGSEDLRRKSSLLPGPL